MEISQFIQSFADQFDEVSVESLTPETAFHDIDEYSSIVALSIIAMIDEEYGVALTGNEMKAAVTIQDLFNTVKAKVS